MVATPKTIYDNNNDFTYDFKYDVYQSGKSVIEFSLVTSESIANKVRIFS